MEKTDIKNNALYVKGLHAGMRMVKADICAYVQGLLMKLYELEAKQSGDEDNNEAIFVASSIYSYINGTDQLFSDMYRQGVLLTEPEMRYGRVANKEESLLPLHELHMKWHEERLQEKKDRNEKK